ncbi:hypothetical protein [Paraherbaspirillum soli]|uniref:Endopeptidase n=1 Tax=Paraherbaspirillum soli TaxID=631222 RepID=A0ABW0MDF2_9BURK
MLSKQLFIAAAIASTVLTGCKKTDETPPPATPMEAPAPQAAPATPAPPPADTAAGTAPAPAKSGEAPKAPGAY